MHDVWQFGEYESVFVEDGGYLYACKEPFNRAGFFAVRDYRITYGVPTAGTYAGADVEYLSNLEPAPVEACAAIIFNESYQTAKHSGMDSDGAREYALYKLEEYGLNESASTAERKNSRYFYAEYCPYGAQTISDGDYLVRFESAKERDHYVFENWKHANAMTRDEARKRYTMVFDENGISNKDTRKL